MDFFLNNLVLFLALILILSLIVSFELRALTGKVKKVSPAELTKMLNSNKLSLIDLRVEQEYKSGHIVNAVNMDKDKLQDNAKDKNLPIVVYAKDDKDSLKAGGDFVNFGHDSVYYLEGGIDAWKSDNMPLSGAVKNGK